MLARSETRYEKASDYSSKKYGNGLEKISMQDLSSLARDLILALSFGAGELRLPPAHSLAYEGRRNEEGKATRKITGIGIRECKRGVGLVEPGYNVKSIVRPRHFPPRSVMLALFLYSPSGSGCALWSALTEGARTSPSTFSRSSHHLRFGSGLP